MSEESRYELTPQMRDYDQLGEHWVPYVLRLQSPHVSLPSVSTDAHGFRPAVGRDGRVVDYQDFIADTHSRKGVLLGSSAAFGVGATSDGDTIPSYLNRISDVRWQNLGGRALNSTQELILLMLHLPEELEQLVVFSGVNNLALAFLARSTSPTYGTYFHQTEFEQCVAFKMGEEAGVRGATRRLMTELRAMLRFGQEKREARQSARDSYQDVLRCYERDLRVLGLIAAGAGIRLTFVLQPVAVWIDKSLSIEEARLFDILDDLGKESRGLVDYLRRYGDRITADLAEVCGRFQVPFLDMNAFAEFAAHDWLFVDRVHLTDTGHALAARILKAELGL